MQCFEFQTKAIKLKLQTNLFSVDIYSNKSLMRFNFIVTFLIQLLSLQVSILYSLHIGKAFPNGIGEFQKLSEKCNIAFILRFVMGQFRTILARMLRGTLSYCPVLV